MQRVDSGRQRLEALAGGAPAAAPAAPPPAQPEALERPPSRGPAFNRPSSAR